MSGSTTELSLATAVDTDDNADYLTLSLANSLRTVDGLFNAVTGHTHNGAHQGAPVPVATIPNAGINNAKLGADVARANLLVNPGLEQWQRGNGAFTANSAYSADRWQIAVAGSDTVSVTKGNAAGALGGGGSWLAAVAFTLGTGAGGSAFYQILLAADVAVKNLPFSFSVWVSTPVAGACVAYIASNGTGGTEVQSAANASGGSFLRVTSANIPNDATYVIVGVRLKASATVAVDNACLVVGSQPSDYVPMHPADDLARCLRYYETFTRTNGQAFSTGGYAFSTTQATFLYFWKAIKVVMPTITLSGAAAFAVAGGAGNSNGTAITATVQGTEMSPITITGAIAVAAVGGNTVLNAAAAATATIVVEANP